MIEWFALKSSGSRTAEYILLQFKSSWKMIHSALENVPDEHWTYCMGKWWYATTMYHLIETMDFYCRDDYESMVLAGVQDTIGMT